MRNNFIFIFSLNYKLVIVMSKSEFTSTDLILWSSQSIHKNELLFDKVLDAYDDIMCFLNTNQLHLALDKEEFLMKILLFVYKNTINNKYISNNNP